MPIEEIIKNASCVLRRLSHAAMRAGREPDGITMVAVSKGIETARIKEAMEAGIRIFGENRVQEAEGKIQGAELAPFALSSRWHMIGHLQTNKARLAVRLFDMIETVDSIRLLDAINERAQEAGKVQKVLIQIKLSDEDAKTGLMEDTLEGILKEAVMMKNVSVEGLMGMPPYSENPEDSRPYFRRLRNIRDSFGLRELSMGMSGDFEVAIEEGATIVRVGTAIFGERKA